MSDNQNQDLLPTQTKSQKITKSNWEVAATHHTLKEQMIDTLHYEIKCITESHREEAIKYIEKLDNSFFSYIRAGGTIVGLFDGATIMNLVAEGTGLPALGIGVGNYYS